MATENDDLMGDIRAAMQENAGEAVEAPETAPVETPQEQPAERPATEGRARDESGRFARADDKSRETLTLKDRGRPAGESPAPTDAAASPSPAPAAPPSSPEPGKEPIAPPPEWKGAGKVKWDRLPREIQGELRDTLQTVAAERAEVAPIKELLDVNRETLVREAGSVAEGVRQLLAFHQLSIDKPLDLINHIAQARGIDLRAAFTGQQGMQPAPGAPAADIQSMLAKAVQQHMQPFVAQLQQQQSQPVYDLIRSAPSNPKYPYFNDVMPSLEHYIAVERSHLGATQPGKVFSPEQILDGAYQRAIWADPTIRAQLQNAATEEANRNNAQQVERARRAAAASLRGSPLPGASANGAANPNASVHDDVRAAASELAGA